MSKLSVRDWCIATVLFTIIITICISDLLITLGLIIYGHTKTIRLLA